MALELIVPVVYLSLGLVAAIAVQIRERDYVASDLFCCFSVLHVLYFLVVWATYPVFLPIWWLVRRKQEKEAVTLIRELDEVEEAIFAELMSLSRKDAGHRSGAFLN